MRYVQLLLLITASVLLASCQTAPPPTPTAVAILPTATTPPPTATAPPTSTATATNPPLPTETPMPTETPTQTPAPTNTPIPRFHASEGFNFQQEDSARAIRTGGSGSWDGGQIFQPEVVYHDGRFHMFYVGGKDQAHINGAIGYAISPDGINWSKSPNNPILQGTTDLPTLYAPAVYFDGSQWVMFVNASENRQAIGRIILRATAPDINGPWTLGEQPMLDQRSSRQWDFQSQPAAIIQLEDELRLYYMALGGAGIQMGMASSPDGLTWTRHDDPTTTELAREGSDPILALGESGQWDTATAASLNVMYNDGKWELFYIGTTTSPFDFVANPVNQKKPIHIGYATSEDGLTWTRHPNNPVLQIYDNCWPLLESIKHEGVYYFYHDTRCGQDGINVFWGTIP